MRKVYVVTTTILIAALLIIAITLSGCSKKKSFQNIIEVQGSDTLLNVAQSWALEFLKTNSEASISVNGGGSGVGIASLISGTTNIATASRTMKEEEIKRAKKEGVIPVETIVANDGIAVIVHKDNPIDKLTLQELSDIFSGKAKNWKNVGGLDKPIVLFSRESSSGTYEFFKEEVLNANNDSYKEINFDASASLLNNTSQITDQVSSNINAIGYTGLGFLTRNVKTIQVSEGKDKPYVEPSIKTVQDKSYVISRTLQVYTSGKPTGATKNFIDFILRKKGQEVVENAGFVSL